MKRLLAAVIGICVVGSVFGQSSFTIVRPADGSKVREKVRVLIPKNSLEDGAYIGVFLGGKFVEATVPVVEGNYRVYTLDTKGRNIPDGELKLEFVKYVGFDSNPRIVDRSSVTVTVGNQMNIPIPAGGIKLRYSFTKGQQTIYKIYENETMSTLSSLSNDIGGHAAQFPTNELEFRILYAVDNTYSTGEALLRMQHLPDKGKDWALLAIEGKPELEQVFDSQMVPVYMRVGTTGRPAFGSVPTYFGFATGASGKEGGTSVYGVDPLPVLPEKAVAPGSTWSAAYEQSKLLSNAGVHELSQITAPYQARGEFLSVEWEMGHPCAKIRNSIAQGSSSMAGQALKNQGRDFGDDKVSLDETIYFALDTHKILKVIRALTIDRKMTVQPGGGGAGGGAGASGGAAPVGGNVAGPAGAAGGAVGSGFVVPDNQRTGGKGGMLPMGGAGGGQRGQGNAPAGSNRGGGGGGAAKTQYVRVVSQQILILEK